ncbi:hypothetical protein IKE71_01355 [Candidatus Saccharibacteria bacterium]|nr:hypothetical protein [Candidatus Saccharibacteria bacterium]
MAATTVDELQVLITAKTAEFQKQLDAVNTKLDGVKQTTSSFSAATVAMGHILSTVVVAAFRKLTQVVQEADQAYKNLSASRTKLATVMQQRGATQQEYDDVIKLTEAEERLGVVSADAQQNGLQELATYVGQADSLKKLTNTMNNLVVQQYGYEATSRDVLQTATMMGKVLQGQTGGMERIGYHLTEDEKKLFNFGTEEERVALLTQIVGENLGDLNHRLGETPVGKQIQLANTWDQLKAQIGELAAAVKNILIPVFSVIANVVGRAIAYIKAFLKLFGIETGNAAASTASVVSDASDAVEGYGDAAEGAAKKAKKALAAFDEMNVLEEQTSSGSGSSGGGGGVDILGDLEASAEAINWGSIIPEIELPQWIQDIKNLFSQIDTKPLQKAWDTLKESMSGAFNAAKKTGKSFITEVIYPITKHVAEQTLPRLFTDTAKMFDQINFDRIADAFKNVFEGVAQAVQLILDIFSDLYEILAPIIGWILDNVVAAQLNYWAILLKSIVAIVKGLWEAIVDLYKKYVKPALDGLLDALKPIYDLFNDMLGSVAENNELFETMYQVIKEVATFLLEGLFAALAAVINVLKWLIETIVEVVNWFTEGFQNIVEIWENAPDFFTAIKESIQYIFQHIGEWFRNLFERALNLIIEVFSPLFEWMDNLYNKIIGVFAGIGNWFRDIFKKAYDGIVSVFQSIGNWFKDRWNDVKNAFADPWGTFCNIGRNIWEGLKAGIGNLAQKMKDMFTGAVDAVKNFLGIHSPSKLFESIGDFSEQGYIKGWEDVATDFQETISSLPTSIDLKTSLNAGLAGMMEDINNAEDDEPVHVTVKVGEDTLLDKVVKGVNDLSFLNNKAVINV